MTWGVKRYRMNTNMAARFINRFGAMPVCHSQHCGATLLVGDTVYSKTGPHAHIKLYCKSCGKRLHLDVFLKPKRSTSQTSTPDDLSEIELEDLKESIAEEEAGKARRFKDVDGFIKDLNEEL